MKDPQPARRLLGVVEIHKVRSVSFGHVHTSGSRSTRLAYCDGETAECPLQIFLFLADVIATSSFIGVFLSLADAGIIACLTDGYGIAVTSIHGRVAVHVVGVVEVDVVMKKKVALSADVVPVFPVLSAPVENRALRAIFAIFLGFAWFWAGLNPHF